MPTASTHEVSILFMARVKRVEYIYISAHQPATAVTGIDDKRPCEPSDELQGIRKTLSHRFFFFFLTIDRRVSKRDKVPVSPDGAVCFAISLPRVCYSHTSNSFSIPAQLILRKVPLGVKQERPFLHVLTDLSEDHIGTAGGEGRAALNVSDVGCRLYTTHRSIVRKKKKRWDKVFRIPCNGRWLAIVETGRDDQQ